MKNIINALSQRLASIRRSGHKDINTPFCRLVQGTKKINSLLVLLLILCLPFTMGFKSRNFNSGVREFNQGNYQKAIVKFERALRKYPIKAIVHYNLGMAYFKVKQYVRAKAALQSAMSLDVRFEPMARFYVGLCYYQEGNDQKAQSELKWVSKICHNTQLGNAATEVLKTL